MQQPVCFFWFRRDLRLHDNAGLYHALNSGMPVVPVFIFDRNILDQLEDRDDARVTFLQRTVQSLQSRLLREGRVMEVHYAAPVDAWRKLLAKYQVGAVYTNRDYEAYAKTRDAGIRALVEERGGTFETFKDHVIFEAGEVQKKTGGHYAVFTPYSKTWLANLDRQISTTSDGDPVSYYLKPYPVARYAAAFAKTGDYGEGAPCPSLASMGFGESPIEIPTQDPDEAIIAHYDRTRDIPGIEGTSRLGVHLRHGTVSIREWARKARALNATFLSELIWRDFYSQILQVYPGVEDRSYKADYDAIPWRNDEADFARWCEGRTGYPIVDAGMRQLNTTGYMHNRVRMIVASFLTKHLLIDWRWGERYFGRLLLDYELASNNGGWQWAAGSGADAAPYFRVFNPTSQLEKFDKDRSYVRQYVREYATPAYPEPMVDHKFARQRALDTYKLGLRGAREEGTR